MASQELVTAVQQRLAFTVVVFDNHGNQSIRHLQQGNGFEDFAMEFDSCRPLGRGVCSARLLSDGSRDGVPCPARQ